MDKRSISETVSEEAAEAIQTGLTKVNIPLYEKFRGKTIRGQKTWELSENESKPIKALAIAWIAGWVIGFALFAYFKASVLGWVLLFACIFGPGAVLWVCIMRTALGKHKKDPVQMRYYDVDYEHNYLTGKGHDYTEEITKEEFFNGKT